MLSMCDNKFLTISETQRIPWIAFILRESDLFYNKDKEFSVYRGTSNNINRYQI